jgi:lipid-A-disaccharide synthase-like uncharacterized protein
MDLMNTPLEWLAWTGVQVSIWKLIGFTGAALFGARWFVQLVASRRQSKPVIPRAFWYMSLLGSTMTLSYFMFSAKQDAVGILQNLLPAFTAGYSLWLDIRHHGWRRSRGAESASRLPIAHGPEARSR